MPDHHYELEVKMSCSGCSGAVERVLKKLEGVKEYKTDLETQKVTVTTDETVDLEKVKTVIGKTGKEIVSAKEVVV
ncbi:iron copper transporter [Tricharina praecox]|uniref:iron copper transporter n=1 Tax=Tricharina praecox TaxID=43433 RepID=UPI00221F674C|nr:iron copper transporter [Tricharina praecox]KAI5857253.1 iron copper transporter [Tricharina praecox]